MIEYIKYLNLGEWAISIVAICLLWRFVIKSFLEFWFKSRLDIQKQEAKQALDVQRDVILRDIEFEKIKLERVLPLIEKINGTIYEHRMLYNSYINLIANKGEWPKSWEEERVKLDKQIIESISAIGIYVPDEFRKLLLQIRIVVSCYFQNALTSYRVIQALGPVDDVLDATLDLYRDLNDCFQELASKYISTDETSINYVEILAKYNLDKNARTTRSAEAYVLAYRYFLVHEIFGSGEIVEAQNAYEASFKSA